jgi:ankyrin repeat protein
LIKLGEDLRCACPLHFATTFGHVEAVEFLLRAGAELEAREEDRLTPLQFATGFRQLEFKDTLDLLIGAGANLNTRDNNGTTPLTRAARRPRLEVTKYLVGMSKNGLDLHAKDRQGRTALHHAVDMALWTLPKYW